MFLIFGLFFAIFCGFLAGAFYTAKIFAVDLLEKEQFLIEKREADFSDVLEKEKKVRELGEMLSKIDVFYQKSTGTVDLFEEVYQTLPPGTYLTEFRFVRKKDADKEKEIGQIALSGYSPDWESLLELEKNLKERFSNVRFSSGIWTQLKDINFLVNIETK